MIILGIGFLSEATAAIIRDGKLVAAVSEERLNRIKQWYGYPEQAILEVLRLAGLTIDQVDYVATHGLTSVEPDAGPFEAKRKLVEAADLDAESKKRALDFLEQRYQHEKRVYSQRTPNYLQTIRNLGRPVKTYGHHHAHAASAFYGSGWRDCTVLTADGWGEDGSASLWACDASKPAAQAMRRISATPTIDSLGYFYGSVTHAMGFKPHRHEGKVLGLAAYCQDPKSYPALRSMVDVDLKTRQFVGHVERGLYLPHFDNIRLHPLLQSYGREDLAAGAQKTLEEVVCALVADLGPDARRLAVAGGVFANVKLNQRLAELDNVEQIYVFPNMGDGGLSVGAAWLAHHELAGSAPEAATSMYLGHTPDTAEILEVLEPSGLKYRQRNDINEAVGELLASGKVVARCSGPMEFGPRALGNRSILYKASEASVNLWLNKRLERSEFMPFAPATLEEGAAERFVNLDSGGESSRFMTMTFNCTPLMRAEAPAAVHVDGTARPQIVRKADNPDLHAILRTYRARSGSCSVINTSFNMHEEPIVCTAGDAVRAFVAAGLPYLALGDFLVENPKHAFTDVN
jgi:carbamoyltransferase